MKDPSDVGEKLRDFTLKTDTVPETFQLAYISQWARGLLHGRSEKNIDDIGLTVGPRITRLKEDRDADDLRSFFRISLVKRDFGAWAAAPGWSWKEGYALFALLKVAEALRHLKSDPPIAAECALEAMEAVGYADILALRKETKNDREKDSHRDLQKHLESHHRTVARKAANAKHDQTTRRLKKKAIKLYESKKWRSVLQAAKHIYPKLEQFIEAKGIRFSFSSERGPKTVYDWLLAHRKKTTSESS